MSSLRTAALCSILFGLAPAFALPNAFAGDPGESSWPHWRGPERDGISRESDWSLQGRELWRAEVGMGYSAFAIAGGRLYTQGFEPASEGSNDGKDLVRCLSTADGKELWRHEVPAKRWAMAHKGGTNVTPVLDGELLFTANREGTFFCFEAASGKLLWQKDGKAEAKSELPKWGFAASPLALEEAVLHNVGRVLAYDKKSGKVLWQSEDLGHAYATPVAFEWKGKRSLAVFNGEGLFVLEREGGKPLLHHPWKTKHDVNAATPIVLGPDNSRVFISSGYDHGCALVELGEEKITPVWESKVMRNHMSTSVLVDDHLYGFDEAVFKCVGLDGKDRWAQRGLGKGAFSVAGGKLLVLSEKGELVIAEASPKEFRELARHKVLDGSACWTAPVLVNGHLYLRNQAGTLVCRDHRSTAD